MSILRNLSYRDMILVFIMAFEKITTEYWLSATNRVGHAIHEEDPAFVIESLVELIQLVK